MALECPNCREAVSFWRSFRTTAWGSFHCKACGSVLGISFLRRMIAAGVWIVLMLLFMEILGLYTLGRPWAYGLMAVLFVVVFHVFERIVLLERRAFTCKRCGYDLQGLTENRCPRMRNRFRPGRARANPGPNRLPGTKAAAHVDRSSPW